MVCNLTRIKHYDRTKLADIIARKIPNEKFVSVSGIAYDISDIVNFDSMS